MPREPLVAEHLRRMYADWEINGIKGMAQNMAHARPLELFFGHLMASTVDVDKLREYVAIRRGEGKANSTINRELALLHRAFVLAHESGKLVSVPKFPVLKMTNVRQGTYTREEIERLCSELPMYLRPVVRFGYLTGRRKGEILALEWRDVDLKRRVLTVRQSTNKTGDPDRVPLEGELYVLMEELAASRQGNCPYVFQKGGKPIGPFNAVFNRAARRAGLEGRLFHDLRRTVSTDLMDAGVDLKTAMAITGHKTILTYQRYHIVNTNGVRDAMARMQAHRRVDSEGEENLG